MKKFFTVVILSALSTAALAGQCDMLCPSAADVRYDPSSYTWSLSGAEANNFTYAACNGVNYKGNSTSPVFYLGEWVARPEFPSDFSSNYSKPICIYAVKNVTINSVVCGGFVYKAKTPSPADCPASWRKVTSDGYQCPADNNPSQCLFNS